MSPKACGSLKERKRRSFEKSESKTNVSIRFVFISVILLRPHLCLLRTIREYGSMPHTLHKKASLSSSGNLMCSKHFTTFHGEVLWSSAPNYANAAFLSTQRYSLSLLNWHTFQKDCIILCFLRHGRGKIENTGTTQVIWANIMPSEIDTNLPRCGRGIVPYCRRRCDHVVPEMGSRSWWRDSSATVFHTGNVTYRYMWPSTKRCFPFSVSMRLTVTTTECSHDVLTRKLDYITRNSVDVSLHILNWPVTSLVVATVK